MKTGLARGSFYLAISSLLFMASGYIIHVWLGQHLGPESYGVYGVVIQVMTALNMIHYVGVPQAVSRVIAQDEARADAVLRTGLILQVGSTVLIAVGFYLAAGPVAMLLNDASLTPYFRISALVLVPYSAMTLYMTGYYNGLHHFRRQALMNGAYSVAKTVAVIGLVYVFHIYGAILGFVISPLIALLFGLHWPRLRGERYPYAPLVRFSLPLIFFSFLSTLQLSVDLLFVKALLKNDVAAGYYTANQNIARLPYFAFTALAYVLLPGISRSVSRDTVDDTGRLISRSLRYAFLLLVPGTAFIAADSAELLDILYGPEYLAAAPSLSLLVVGLGFLTLFALLSNVLSGAGSPGLAMVLAGLGLLTTVGFCYVLIPPLGLSGAALATTLGSLLAVATAAAAVYRRFRTVIPVYSVVRIVAAGVPVYLAARIVSVPLALLPVMYAALFFMYLLILRATMELTHWDAVQLRALLPFRSAVSVPSRSKPHKS